MHGKTLFTLVTSSHVQCVVNVDTLFQAKHAYEAQQDDELNLKPGDTLKVLNADNNDWWTVEDVATGKQGLVPSNVRRHWIDILHA